MEHAAPLLGLSLSSAMCVRHGLAHCSAAWAASGSRCHAAAPSLRSTRIWTTHSAVPVSRFDPGTQHSKLGLRTVGIKVLRP